MMGVTVSGLRMVLTKTAPETKRGSTWNSEAINVLKTAVGMAASNTAA
jgi:hypothetical protein